MIGGEALAPYRSLYLRRSGPRLHLNAFRGVRAISGFDWPFTPTHRSSESFSTLTGSALQLVLPSLQPAHASITRFRVCSRRLRALFGLAFAPAPSLRDLASPATATRRLIMQKARRHSTNGAPTACRRMVSGSLSLPFRGPFHLSLTVLVRYRSLGSI